MSFPTKDDRQKCWDSRDRYWGCLDQHPQEQEKCQKLRQAYESSCPSQWVKHFDRKREYLKFKARIEKEGPHIPSHVVQRTTDDLQGAVRRHRIYKDLVCTLTISQ